MGLIPVPHPETFDPSGVQISVGDHLLQMTNYAAFAYSDVPTATFKPLQAIQLSLPSGAAGTSADLTISNAYGTATAKSAVSYLPGILQYALRGGQLAQGVYDPRLDLYYFTDLTQIRVFSRNPRSMATAHQHPELPGVMRYFALPRLEQTRHFRCSRRCHLPSRPRRYAFGSHIPSAESKLHYLCEALRACRLRFGHGLLRGVQRWRDVATPYSNSTQVRAQVQHMVSKLLQRADAYQRVLLSSDNQPSSTVCPRE